jgi:NADH:ubiquinone reductase (H+-translocating)
MSYKPRVVIIGAGFGGLAAARTLKKAEVQITLIDRNNYHTFTPLLYQVATCALDPSAIAYPVRTVFRHQANLRFLMGEAEAIDTQTQTVTVATQSGVHDEGYDYLIIAAGTTTNYFGNASIEAHGFSLKTLADAVTLRNHILRLFEKAVWSEDPATRESLLTFVVVGGGPTGLETAGALYELYNHVITQEYGQQQPAMSAKVILLEARENLLDPYPPRLQRRAVSQLESLGVEVMLKAVVAEVTPHDVRLVDGRVIPTYTVVWSAGVRGTGIAPLLGVELGMAGCIPVTDTLEVKGLSHVYAVGDIAHLPDDDGKPYAKMIPVARQQGIQAAKNIFRAINSQPGDAFAYRDLGIMATIGRSRAVAWIFNRIQLSGYLAWLAWLFLHLIALMGFRNRLSVFINWVWNYLTYDRSVRMILDWHAMRPVDTLPDESAPAEE